MIASGNDKVMKSSALFNLGWIYETTGETEKSTALYRQLLSDFPDSTYSEWVKEKVRS
jgi:TolA-binding protein